MSSVQRYVLTLWLRRRGRGVRFPCIAASLAFALAPSPARAQARAGASASASGGASASDTGGMCFGCDPYYYHLTWWWSVYASGGLGWQVNGNHQFMGFGRFGPSIGFGDGDWALMLEGAYLVSAESKAAASAGLWLIYDGAWWVEAGGIADFDAGHQHGGAFLSAGWTLFGIEAQARRYDPSVGLGDVLALYATLKVPYGLAAVLLGLPKLPGGGVIWP